VSEVHTADVVWVLRDGRWLVFLIPIISYNFKTLQYTTKFCWVFFVVVYTKCR